MAWLLGWSAGVVLQWQQAALWPAAVYGALLVAAALAGGSWRWLQTQRQPAAWVAALACAALLGFASTGLRALHQQADVLAPLLEERDMWLRGTVADLPQSHPDGQTVVVAVDRADIEGRPVAVPRRVRLFWPGAPTAVQAVQAGQIWRWPVRLRAPHGLANPHGFDRELWLWEQGVGATGVVRVGRHVLPPEWLGDSPWFLIDRWRGQLTVSIRERVDDPRSAGVIAALLVGNQSAISLEADIKVENWASL